MKPFLILQLRSETEAADDEYQAFLKYGGIAEKEVVRVRMEQAGIPPVDLAQFSGIIIGGGPSNVSDLEDQKPDFQKRFEKDLDQLLWDVYEQDFPFLGSCYGFGKLIQRFGGMVSKEKYAEEVGFFDIKFSAAEDDLINGLGTDFLAFGGHKEACQTLPKGAVLLASSDQCPYQMIRMKHNIYATQFHVELDGSGLAVRIEIYKNHGYFPPEEADTLIDKNKDVSVSVPMIILKRFIDKYRS